MRGENVATGGGDGVRCVGGAARAVNLLPTANWSAESRCEGRENDHNSVTSRMFLEFPDWQTPARTDIADLKKSCAPELRQT